MRLFSKIALIFNACFLILVFFYFNKSFLNSTHFVQPFGMIKGSIVVLGEIAWIVDAFFLMVLFIRVAFKMKHGVAKWIIVFNFLALLGAIYFFIIDKS